MKRSFNLGRLPSGTPNIINFKYTAGQTFVKGALVVDTAAGTISECGADPVSILGIAQEAAASKAGNTGIANAPTIITGGNRDEVAVAVADRSQVFTCRGVNGGTDPVTPLVTNIGENYGVAKDADGSWYLDLAEVTVMQFEVVDIDIDNKLFFVKIMESRIALP